MIIYGLIYGEYLGIYRKKEKYFGDTRLEYKFRRIIDKSSKIVISNLFPPRNKTFFLPFY
jgi:hypothetical protein